MEVTRVRFGSVLEWLIAAACIVAALGVGSIVIRELQSLRAATRVIAEEAPAPEPPAVAPPRTISVPMLLLADGTDLRVGERATSVDKKINPRWQVGSDALERRSNGARLTRTYDDGTTHFLLVFEPIAPGVDARVAAIYTQ